MKIWVTKKLKGFYERTTFKAERMEFCCEELKSAWDKFVGFGEKDGYSDLNTSNKVNIYQCHPYPEGAAWDECAISFCPFCATKIEITILAALDAKG